MTKAQWIDLFVMQLSRLQVRAEPHRLAEMAEELHPDFGHLNPVDLAQAEYDEWPPLDD
jgi:hypothetical protein